MMLVPFKRVPWIVSILVAVIVSAPTGLTSCGLPFLQPVITVDPNATFQTISGWEAVAQAGELLEPKERTGQSIVNPAFPHYKDLLFDQAVNDLGINRVRLEVPSGIERPDDFFSQYVNGELTFRELRQQQYKSFNDNEDPNVVDTSGFQFSFVDHAIEQIVVPLKTRLEARGEKLFVNAQFVAFDPSSFAHRDHPEEYAELVLLTYLHMQTTYGFVPDSWSVILEPDTSAAWSATQIREAIVAAGRRLRAYGFEPEFVAPETTSMQNASRMFDVISENPEALEYTRTLSYHRYQGVSDANLQAIADRAVRYGLETAMLEHIDADYQTLHQDLKLGRNSAWQQFVLAFPGKSDSGGNYYWIDQADPDQPGLHVGSRTTFLRQYFRYIRRGAVRIGASGGSAAADPLAFVNPDGTYVLVVKASGAGSFSVNGLPPGRYGVRYTTPAATDVDAGEINVEQGQPVTAQIPAAGVMTIYGIR